MQTALDPAEFRDAMARFASGVTVVTTRDTAGAFVGFTASAFTSLSLNPPLMLVCLQKDADCYQAFTDSDEFAVSILATGQSSLATRFATKGIDKWDGTPSITGPNTGIPMIEACSAQIECRVHSRPDGGDHTILIGEVIWADSHPQCAPLLHFNRTFGRFTPDEAA
ncbi:MAG TPA: flavin reductase family protein [Dehalococcoidia bacterium]|nr:flavin reductase family protein [Dehalococcoidia bacterium]